MNNKFTKELWGYTVDLSICGPVIYATEKYLRLSSASTFLTGVVCVISSSMLSSSSTNAVLAQEINIVENPEIDYIGEVSNLNVS